MAKKVKKVASRRAATVKVSKIKKVSQTKKGKKVDSKKDALEPGKRKSKFGTTYYERRSDRAD